jgi:hypothetical protein
MPRNYTYTAPQTNLKRHHLLPSEPATKEEVMDFDEDCSSETEFEEKEDEVIDRGSLVGQAAPTPTVEGKVPFVSPPINEEDKDVKEDGDKEDDDNGEEEEYTNEDEEKCIFDFDLNDVEGMSKYKMMRLQRIRRNEAKLTSLGLLKGMTSATSPSSNRTNRKKRAAPQGDFVRRVQPKILMTLSSAREHVPLILLTPEMRILTARGWTRQSTAPAAEMMRRRMTRTS